ncbi:MAG: ABC transporter permease [Verrucomicrobiales bacterium]|nr:ABC transporter permease [Verrucomicrobiales bacterium]
MEAIETAPEFAAAEKGSSLGKDAWFRLKKNRLAMICLWVFVAITVLCVGGLPAEKLGLIADPNAINLEDRSVGPSAEYWMGTDHIGRDIFSRILAGGRISLMVGFLATLVSMTIGVVYGSVAGFFGGRLDSVMMRIVDILYALPFMIFVIILTTFFGNKLWLLFIAIGAVEWLTMARIVRGQVMSLKKMEFVEAARSLGLGNWKLIFRHLIPNTLGPVIIYTTLTVPAVMLLESVLSFLGLGVMPPDSSWGTLIKEGADRMLTTPWLLIFPALFFSATLFCLNFLGDGLRDALDPKTSKD